MPEDEIASASSSGPRPADRFGMPASCDARQILSSVTRSTRVPSPLTLVRVSNRTPTTVEELREKLAAADVTEEMREVVERLFRAVHHAMNLRGVKMYRLEEEGSESGKGRGHLTRVFAGERADLEVMTLKRYARACGVREAWLVSGDGLMLDAPTRTVELNARYPHLAAAVRVAELEGVDPSVLETVQRDALKSSDDPLPSVWIKRIDGEANYQRRRAMEDPDVDAAKVERDRLRALDEEKTSKPNLTKKPKGKK